MDIDFPLLETTRPPMYTFDKYVGKKPHNIWASYIEAYTKKNGIVLSKVIFGMYILIQYHQTNCN